MSHEQYTLHSGAAAGTEASFGENAEAWNIKEVNYSFEGHRDQRTRGVKVLSPKELMTGDVSLAYVGRMMNRVYKDTPLFRNVLRSIWHQVNKGQEIFVVGTIKEDGTVKGGTGWGAEFAKLCNKRLFVFDQPTGTWMTWENTGFVKCETLPCITETDFTGTGTRTLEENGRQAIADLFTRSFG